MRRSEKLEGLWVRLVVTCRSWTRELEETNEKWLWRPVGPRPRSPALIWPSVPWQTSKRRPRPAPHNHSLRLVNWLDSTENKEIQRNTAAVQTQPGLLGPSACRVGRCGRCSWLSDVCCLQLSLDQTTS